MALGRAAAGICSSDESHCRNRDALGGCRKNCAAPPRGEQQRVAIARAIVSSPDVLILDEPTASLDGDTGRKIVDFVRREILSDKRSILIVTHDDRIFEYADRMLKMEDGRIVGVEKGGRSA